MTRPEALAAALADLDPAAGPVFAVLDGALDAVGKRRVGASSRRIGAYLRRNASDQTASISDRELDDRTRAWMREAREIGVKTEAGMGRWCYLQAVSGGRIGHQSDILTYVKSGDGASADTRVRMLMLSMVEAARAGQG
ncbi:MAG: hypothetical protein MUE98_12600 [Rhodobacteraceae bacterium]|jgi:hypothetical protein|nr:hypothetical protein [Paracoccaceae bacterium]